MCMYVCELVHICVHVCVFVCMCFVYLTCHKILRTSMLPLQSVKYSSHFKIILILQAWPDLLVRSAIGKLVSILGGF